MRMDLFHKKEFHCEVYSIQHNVINIFSDLQQVGDFPTSYTNKTDHHDIAELLLKVALKTINISPFLKTQKPSILYSNRVEDRGFLCF